MPRLLQRRSPVMASLIVFVMWLTWHLPLFCLPGSAQEGSSIATYILLIGGLEEVSEVRGGGP